MARKENTRALKTYIGHYEFAIDGGASSAHVLRSDDGPIPKGAVVVGGYMRVVASPTSAAQTAQIAISVEGANDIITAAAVSGAPWSSTGFKDIIPDNTGSTAVVTTAERSPTATVTVQVLTAGTFDVVLLYI